MGFVAENLFFQPAGGVSNPTELIYTVPANQTLYLETATLSYGTSASAGSAEAVFFAVQYGPSIVGGLNQPSAITTLLSPGDHSVRLSLTLRTPLPIPPGSFVWLYVSSTPPATDLYTATFTGYLL